jgi:phosphatidylethanolamine-binding protein (PEBP) family uncharacterized protein
MRKHAFAFAGAAMALGCLTLAAPASAMSLSFTWVGTAACSSTPPAFKIASAPEGTKYLDFELKDFDAPNFKHGGGTVDYTGQSTIPAGAFSYTGPCPPSGAHRYQWTVTALDAGKHAIGRATATASFPPK